MPESILLLVLMVVAFYFLLIRPQQKKQREHQSMMTELAPGSRIMTNAGVFGTIVHMGEKQAIIEVAPGVEMTVLKQAIMRVVNPSEDEFEYDDDALDALDDGVEDVEDDAAVEADPVTVEDAATAAADDATDGDAKH
ncbi:MAG: preprotein translocase subunit YajC [Propioniciclava sp.]